MGIGNDEDVIDSREIIERIEELDQLRIEAGSNAYDAIMDDPGIRENGQDVNTVADMARETALSDFDKTDEGHELKTLQALASECEGYGDWDGGETLIRGTHFTEYAQQMADDTIEKFEEKSSTWPFNCIDWDKASDELKHDYMAVDYDGVEYWMRA